MKKLLLFIGMFLISSPAFAQKSSSSIPAKPKLVVGIVVDQMRYDFLFRFWDLYSDGGFKRLVNDGFLCQDARYNYFLTTTGPGHSTIYTGATPSIHGIVDNIWYDRLSKKEIYCASDSGTFTTGLEIQTQSMSPYLLRSSTMTDELKLASKQSRVIGIALKDRAAIMPAGHMADGAYWYDAKTGKWITSTWYKKSLPDWLSDYNRRDGTNQYLNQTWGLLLQRDRYKQCTGDSVIYEDPLSNETLPIFPHHLGKHDYSILPFTPFANTMTKDIAINAIKSEQLGKQNATDFLCISFSSTDLIGHKFGPNSLETEDCYLRLDRDLQDLFKFLDSYVGLNNVLIFLTADHGVAINPQFAEDNKLEGGLVQSDQWKDSINNYISNFYGRGSWVSDVTVQQVYLDYDFIAESKKSCEEIAVKVKEYLLNKKEVLCVTVPEYPILNDCSDYVEQLIMNGYQHGRSGDILFSVSPGWVDWTSMKGSSHGTIYSYDNHVPLIFYGWKVPHGSSAASVVISDIAPTVSNWLNIAFPSGCTGKPITDIRLK
ncbi:MAG: alkaline phosphatase family protein [Chitinophagales bacterium]|nr:alkaline phosphatase family protein [Chitinophagales bacterium]